MPHDSLEQALAEVELVTQPFGGVYLCRDLLGLAGPVGASSLGLLRAAQGTIRSSWTRDGLPRALSARRVALETDLLTYRI